MADPSGTRRTAQAKHEHEPCAVVPVVAFAGALLVVGALVLVCLIRSTGNQNPAADADLVQQTESTATHTAAPPPSNVLTDAPALEVVAAEAETHDVPSLEELLQSQLEAGEFGPALETALQASDAPARTHLLQLVSGAQLADGAFEAADRTASRIPLASERTRARTRARREQGLSGGGTGADFDSLIELVTTTVEPESWEDIGGPGTIKEYETGVRVDPNGQLQRVSKEERDGKLAALGVRARKADLNDDMAQPSTMRMVSLPRLERAVAQRLNQGQRPLETMQHLAGLQAVHYVFVYPEEGELVIAGPAEGWRIDEEGRTLGNDSGWPVLQLDDLVVMLRTFSPSGRGIFGCSINPRTEGLRRMKEFVEASNARGPLRPGQRRSWLKELRDRLGQQDIEIYGIPGNTRVARIIVEADYRMKLIGVGRVDGGPDIPDYFQLLRRHHTGSAPPLEALRWWLTMKYDAVLHSPDKTAFEVRGSSVLVQSENQFVTSQGRRIGTGKAEPINRMFAGNFTEHYAELAARDKVFAELQSVFDLALVAALGTREKLPERTAWDLGVFGPEGSYRVAEVRTPRTVESVIAHRVYGGRQIVVQVAGGVRGNLKSVVHNKQLRGEDPQLPQVHARGHRSQLLEGRWWWDAATGK